MQKYLRLLFLFLISGSCRTASKPDAGKYNGDKVFSLRIKPVAGSKYNYDISNESKTNVEVDNKDVESVNNSEVRVNYTINIDSANNYQVLIRYSKIHIYTKSGDAETDLDTGDSTNSSDPVSQMLGAVKNANIVATVTPAGEVVKVEGYRDILNKIGGGIEQEDPSTRAIIQNRWQQMVEQNLVKKNMSQFFKTFPDSAVHIGDKWKFATQEKDQIALNFINTYYLKSIEDGNAYLESNGQISSDSSSATILSYDVSSNLQGQQEGEYKVNIKTGMPVYVKVVLKVKGTIQVNGRDIPFTLKSSVQMKEY